MENGRLATRRIFPALLIATSSLVAVTAAADESSRWSLGMQLGQARGDAPLRGGTTTLVADLDPASYDVSATVGESNRLGWRVFTGYRFTDYLAVHVGYTDLGEAQTPLADGASTVRDAVPAFEPVGVQSVRGVDLGLQLKVPLSERIWVDAHGGKYFWRSHTRTNSAWGEYPRDSQRSTESDSDYFFGAGVEVSVMMDLSATLGWTEYRIAGEPVALWTVGALYRFGIY